MILTDISIRRPVFATMMMVALVVLGIAGYQRLAVDEYPDVTYPIIIAQTQYPGASPEVVEREVSRPLEQALNTVQGLREIYSTSLEGSSLVRLVFELDADVMAAQQDVQAKVSRARRALPRDIDDPVVIRFDPNDSPILSVAMQSGERPLRELTSLADEVVAPRLQSVPGVGGVNLVGGAKREIRVQLDPGALRAYGLAPDQVGTALDRENREVPAGRVERGQVEKLVRVSGRIDEPLAFADIVVAVRNGAPVRVRDLGTVVDGSADVRSAAFRSETPAVSLEVLKISGANTVEVSDRVKAMIDELGRGLPADVRLTVIRDDAKRIKEALADVQLSLVLGAVLTIAIIYLFLNSWRSTVITGLTLPVSIVSAFFVMWALDFTLNTMTLLALSLAIGLLIDDAIVVRENIVRHIEMGKDHVTASKEGTDEIGLAVLSTTLAVVAVFVPVAFMGGQIGKIFFQFGVTVAFAVLVSLFVSFTLDPMLSSVWPDPEVKHGGHDVVRRTTRNPLRRLAFAFDDWFERQAGRYRDALAWAMARRGLVLVAGLVSVVAAGALYPLLGFTWMPDFDGGEFNVSYRVPPGSRIEHTLEKGRALDQAIRRVPGVDFTYMTVGGGFRGTPAQGNVYIRLAPRHERAQSQDQLMNVVRAEIRKIPGLRAQVLGTPSIFGGRRQPIQINVQGPEQSRLRIAAEQVMETVKGVPGVAEPTSAQEEDIPQLDIRVDRQQAWAAGLGIAQISGTVQPLLNGLIATRWEDPQGYSHDVRIVYADSLRASPEDIRQIVIPSANLDPATGRAAMVPLAQVADVQADVGPQAIERRMLERTITVSAGVLPGFAMGDVAAAARRALGAVGLPTGYFTSFGGDAQNLDETKGFVVEALLLAVVFIYLIIASIFGSFVQPLSIMLALPLSLLGVTLALLVTRGTLNIMSMIGIIMLMGLVTKNGILLIDFVNQRRAEGADRLTAILDSARVRVRPIIMTTVAMIAGMLPLAFAIGEGAEQRAPMAHAVIGGLVTSTLLTLFVVPVVYSLIDDAGRRLRGRGQAPPAPVPVPGD
ncbi:MAG: efflux RND transporter permease subunit [Gemmatimonadota bacterium]|jgi:HAE1 family hydrophobic/amphiphilic exporter-1|nr:efflux RND transporter permease subunit [Gemmatimonadota bacterium]